MDNRYGLRMFNFEAASVVAVNDGARTSLDYKKSMLSNSLFLDFLKDNGLKIYKNSSTRDIININFSYGTPSAEDEIKIQQKIINEELKKKNEGKNFNQYKIDLATERKKFAEENQELFIKRSREKLREEVYENGLDITYTTRNKKGEILRSETIHYVYLYRSVGKAKNGGITMCRKQLYNRCINFLRMGIKLPKRNAKIVEISAYSPLIASSIVDKIHIAPENILILKDIESAFVTKVASVEKGQDGHCFVNYIDEYEVTNIMFDGEALIESSIFPQRVGEIKNGDPQSNVSHGMILLRQHFFKAAAFCTHIQKFFQDYYGDNYETAYIEDMWGNKHKVTDIKMITTHKAIKWMAFEQVTYEYWCEWVNKNGAYFGIVKTPHPSKIKMKLDKNDTNVYNRTSYQMNNTLTVDIMPQVVENHLQYIQRLKNEPEVFLDYLRQHQNFSNDYECLVYLAEHNPCFQNSEYFKDRKKEIIRRHVDDFRSGHICQVADNVVICGSPYALLLYAVGEDIENDTTLCPEANTIQCYSEKFADGEYLCAFRSPHNSQNNIVYLHNVKDDRMSKYFNLTEMCLALNVRHTDIQDRANGADFDADTFYLTNQPQMVEHAKQCYQDFPTVVNNTANGVAVNKQVWDNTWQDFCKMDINGSNAQKDIGASADVAQLALTYYHTFGDDKYKDYACMLAVYSQCAIDSIKRKQNINITEEIEYIRSKMDIKKYKKPIFWKYAKMKTKGKFKNAESFMDNSKYNPSLICPMNYVATVKIEKAKFTPSKPMEDYFVKFPLDVDRRKCLKVEELIEKYSIDLVNYNQKDYESSYDKIEEDLLLREDFEQLLHDIRKIYISKNYKPLMSWLIDRAFCITAGRKYNIQQTKSNLNKNRALLMNVLYKINPTILLEVLSKNMQNC